MCILDVVKDGFDDNEREEDGDEDNDDGDEQNDDGGDVSRDGNVPLTMVCSLMEKKLVT